MATVSTTKRINLDQLDREIGQVGLNADGDLTSEGTTKTITTLSGLVSEAQLQAAVNAHVAVDMVANRTSLQDQAVNALQSNRDFVALAAPTNAQVIAQVKALSRQVNGLIRLALNRLDATD